MVKVSGLFYTIQEAAAYLKVERHTVGRWIQEGRFPAEKVGTVILIERAAIEKLLERRS